MLKNYFKIAAHAFHRYQYIWIGCWYCYLFGHCAFIQDELSYDKYNDKADQIVRITFHGKMKGQTINESTIMPRWHKRPKLSFRKLRRPPG